MYQNRQQRIFNQECCKIVERQTFPHLEVLEVTKENCDIGNRKDPFSITHRKN